MSPNTTPQNFAELVDFFIGILSLVVPLIFSLALLFIIWKIVDAWILNSDNPGKVDEGKQYALWGVLVLVVMSAIWGILALLRSSIFGS